VSCSRAGRVVLTLAVPVGLVVLWWWTSRDSTSYLYPPLGDVIASFREDWLTHLESDLVPSLGRFGAGYLLAAAAGIGTGTLIGLAPRLRRATQPVVEFVRSIPPPLLLPLLLVLLGVGNDSKVVLIAFGALWPVLLNTIDGVRGVEAQVLDMARSFRLGWRVRVTHVILPAASPKIVAGLRTALSIALVLMVVSEMIGGTNGLGFQIRRAQRSFDGAATYAGVIVIGAVGLIANGAFLLAENRIMRWHRGDRGLLDTQPQRASRAVGGT
jgi:ABC-type nitrate/sulfonate/bicarbonate transport system permease component